MRSYLHSYEQATIDGRQQPVQEHYERPNTSQIKGRKTTITPKGSLAIYLDFIESMGTDRSKGLEYLANLGLKNIKFKIDGGEQ